MHQQQNEKYITEAYNKYYHVFIKKAMGLFGHQKDKAFDCVQEVVLRLLEIDFEIENVIHARSLIYKSINWHVSQIKTLRKKWGAYREIKYDFTSPTVQDHLSEPVQPVINGYMNYWPQSNRYFNHINKLSAYHQQIIRLTLLGCGNLESISILGKKIKKNTYGSSKDAAIKMLRDFKVANELRSSIDRSNAKRKNSTDNRTDRIMEMTAAGIPDKEIASQLGLTINNVKCRKHDRRKLINKMNQ